MSVPDKSESPVTLDHAQAAIARAYEAMNTACVAVRDAQDMMKSAGVPDLIVDHLEDARLSCMNTGDFPPVVGAVGQLQSLADAKTGEQR